MHLWKWLLMEKNWKSWQMRKVTVDVLIMVVPLQDSETSSTGAEVSTTVDILETIANDIESIVKVTLSA